MSVYYWLLTEQFGQVHYPLFLCFLINKMRSFDSLDCQGTFEFKIMWLAKRKESLPYYNHWWANRSFLGRTKHCHLMTGLVAEGCIQLYSWWWTWGWHWVNEMGYNLTHSDPELNKVEREGSGLRPGHVEE